MPSGVPKSSICGTDGWRRQTWVDIHPVENVDLSSSGATGCKGRLPEGNPFVFVMGNG